MSLDLDRIIPTGPYAGMTALQKFALFVRPAPSGCWEWIGKLYRNGYGTFSIGTKGYLAHRVALLIAGRPPQPDQVVRHQCDNPACVNPGHLLVGTPAENIQDAIDRGRLNPARGSRAARAKLSEEQVRSMRSMNAMGVLQKDIARSFGISPKQVSVIVNRRQWGHLG